MFGLETSLFIILIICIVAACAFEFINGFHDTANAVATVIYTHSLKPAQAVVLSGVLNFVGVFSGGIGVAVGIINLLPPQVLTDQNVYQSVAMILSLIITAILWNLGTWYYGIPCSSSHTLIGSILGVGLAYGFIHNDISSVNWTKASEIGLSLMFSPVFGFLMTMLMMYVLRFVFVKNEELFIEPDKTKYPPWWIRGTLILTCSGVSFAHGSNDGQKGVGLVMIILIAIVPTFFSIQDYKNPHKIQSEIQQVASVINTLRDEQLSNKKIAKDITDTKEKITEIGKILNTSFAKSEIPKEKRFIIRKNILEIDKKIKKNINSKILNFTKQEKNTLKKSLEDLKSNVNYAPFWVLLIISISLGLGTMIGWKKIVVTIGEKIGKAHLNYAQGASAEMITAGTILLSSAYALPVSTTHILSSGVAGSMTAQGGLKNLQRKTLTNIALAWILTLPVCIVGAGFLYFLLHQLL
ncbi:MAG: anion permease [Cytophagales bacterium]|nr:MAG: anion permease [Cytophagales bacterium]TAH27964.1 MAG: anion permease [Cytophagales bacterium]